MFSWLRDKTTATSDIDPLYDRSSMNSQARHQTTSSTYHRQQHLNGRKNDFIE